MDTSTLSNENLDRFNVLNTNNSAVVNALHNINMDAILFRSKTSPTPPILVQPASVNTTHVLTVPELVQATVSGQSLYSTVASGATGTNESLSFGPDTAANALALLSLLNLNKLTNPRVRMTFNLTSYLTSWPDITTLPASIGTYVVSPNSLIVAGTGTAGCVVQAKLTAVDLSTYDANGVLVTPKIQFVALA